MTSRRTVIGGLTVLAAVLTAVLLWEVVATVFFAMTVAYVLGPVRRQLRRRGLSARVAAGVTTFAAFLGLVAALTPLLVVLVLRVDDALAFLETIPESVTVLVGPFEYTLVTAEVAELAGSLLLSAGGSIAGAAPVLLVKLALFAFVVYAVLYYEQRTRQAALALVPPSYRTLGETLHDRARRTLYGIYVVQAATGFATFLIALPVFVAFGYPSPVVLATLAGILQFIPVVGPSVLVLALAGYHVVLGDTAAAVAILVVGWALIAATPDFLLRPRLAAETAEIPATLYFIGFFGGVLTIGPIGIIAGPLAVAVVAELAAHLSTEMNAVRVREEPLGESVGPTDPDGDVTVTDAEAVEDADTVEDTEIHDAEGATKDGEASDGAGD
ncbi:AI-2E family transporter [Halorubrum gandharaense]